MIEVDCDMCRLTASDDKWSINEFNINDLPDTIYFHDLRKKKKYKDMKPKVCPQCNGVGSYFREAREGECDHDNGICVDEAHGTHSGICRACGNHGNDLSNDDGYCGDCN
jgi:hypothetical protein